MKCNYPVKIKPGFMDSLLSNLVADCTEQFLPVSMTLFPSKLKPEIFLFFTGFKLNTEFVGCRFFDRLGLHFSYLEYVIELLQLRKFIT